MVVDIGIVTLRESMSLSVVVVIVAVECCHWIWLRVVTMLLLVVRGSPRRDFLCV